jgi:phosphohistidine phosphatase
MPTRSFEAFPEQAAAIPVRRAGRGLQVCVIRRKDASRWGIPKGLVDPGATHEETALNEAWEEAGIRGRLLGAAIGTYRYKKWGARLTVAVYVMEVLEQAPTWEEKGLRERRWVPFTEAGVLLGDHPVATLLGQAHTLVTAGRHRIA